jgi:hypothetical protein
MCMLAQRLYRLAAGLAFSKGQKGKAEQTLERRQAEIGLSLAAPTAFGHE